MAWMDGDVVVAGVRLHYLRAGHGSPILLLHGVTDAGPCWGRTADALARTHDVILLDQRAHGRSEAPERGYTLADFAGDAAGVIRELGVAPAAIVGHSLGARVGLTVAATSPAVVAWLVLEYPPLEVAWSSPGQPAEDADRARAQWFEWVRSLRTFSRDNLAARRMAESPTWSPDECARWAESKLAVNPRLWGPGGLEIGPSWRQEMEHVSCPVLLVRGDVTRGALVDDDQAAEALRLVSYQSVDKLYQLVDDDQAAEALRLMRRGEEVCIAGAGHSIHRDQCEAFIAAVGPFLGDDSPAPAPA